MKTTKNTAKMINDLNLTDAFTYHKPVVKAEFAARYQRVFDKLREMYGDKVLTNMYTKAGYAMGCIVSPVVSKAEGFKFNTNEVYYLDAEKVDRMADFEADKVLKAWQDKLNAKLIGATDATVTEFYANYIEVTAKLGDATVTLRQQRIFNFTIEGNMYQQFPALIYVDGKKVSEAAYKKMTAAA